MLRHIHLEQLRRICGLHHSPLADFEQRQQRVDRLCELYDKGIKLCPSDQRLSTDFAPFDSYALLASHLLLQMWFESNQASPLYR